VLTGTRHARLVNAWRRGLPAPWRTLLAPCALAYRSGLRLRNATYALGVARTRRLPCRVLAVGNLTVGGTGKTPLVELIARTIAERGRSVAIVSRGYGGRATAPVSLVSDGTRVLLGAAEAGDEPVLLARRLLDVPRGVPVVVGRDRFRAGALAVARFAPDVVVLDDGFQQRRLAKDVEVVCLDARAPWGHGGLLPGGSLREPPKSIRRAHLLVLTHAEACPDLVAARVEVGRLTPVVPVAVATLEPIGVLDVASGQARPLAALAARPALAFAGIAAPERFIETLGGLGITPRAFVPFPDHHPYAPEDLDALATRARAAGAEVLLTTEKDAVRLRAPAALPVWALQVRLHLTDADGAWWAALLARLGLP
jgi:tetraacyldisaccharide 4'-kinase